MKKVFVAVIAVMIGVFSVSLPAEAQTTRKGKTSTTKVSKPKKQETFTKGFNPLVMTDAAWNTGGESLQDFIRKFCGDARVRYERSRGVKMGFYDSESGLSYNEEMNKEAQGMWDDYCNSLSDKEWTNLLLATPGEFTTKSRQERSIESWVWDPVSPSCLVFRYNTEFEDIPTGEGFGSSITIIFERERDGWHVVGFSMAG